MPMSESQLSDLKSLVATDQWQLYLTWIESRLEATFQEMMRYETEQEQFIRLHARLRTLLDVSYFFERELFEVNPRLPIEEFHEAQTALKAVDSTYQKRFLSIFRRLFERSQ